MTSKLSKRLTIVVVAADGTERVATPAESAPIVKLGLLLGKMAVVSKLESDTLIGGKR